MIGMIWTAMACDEHDQQLAGMRPVPCSYYDIKGRPDKHLRMEACDKEIKKLFEMGTFFMHKVVALASSSRPPLACWRISAVWSVCIDQL